MIDEVLKKLIEFLQQASPLVWEALVRQVYAIAFSQIAWAVGVGVSIFAMWKFSNYAEKQQTEDEYNEEEWKQTKLFFRVGAVLFMFIPFGLIVSASMKIYNPAYYAINLILSQIK